MHVQKYYVWLALLCCSLSAQVQAGQKVKTPMHLPNTHDVVARPFMQRIPAGDFLMGSPPSEEGRNDDEGPQHLVQVAAFELGKTEVTVGQFRAFVEDRAYVTDAQRNAGNKKGCRIYDEQKGEWAWKADYNWKNLGYRQTEEQPVVCVSWHDTQAYIKWLNQQTGQQYRLLSEAEWEYAARGGTHHRHWHGDDPAGLCTYANGADQTRSPHNNARWTKHARCKDGYWYPAPVGRLASTAYGLKDLFGNVWEWTADCWHDSYEDAPRDGQAWLTGGNCSLRVLRGGSWINLPDFLRAAIRDGSISDYRDFNVGFRLARTL